jgi:hypothetical protein
MKHPGKLKIKTLSADWCDKDVVMLHACFQLLTDCVEKEKLLDGNTNWNHSKATKKVKAEITALYKWWTKRKEIENELEPKQYEMDNKMLIRLIKIRKHLWT